MNTQIHWIEKLKQFQINFQNKNFWYKELEYTEPISEEKIIEIEKKNNVKIPNDFKEVIKTIASSCIFEWSIYKIENIKQPLDSFKVVKGCNANFLWNVEQVRNINDYLIADYGFDPNYIFEFMYTGCGDIIAFDTTNGLDNAPVIYISHDGGEVGEFPDDDKKSLHGYRLGYNFIDFMDRWINLGCPGNEYHELIPFYDFEEMVLMKQGEVVNEWLKWINE